jgi:hypothetical protein
MSGEIDSILLVKVHAFSLEQRSLHSSVTHF